jgi:hypothetical protein
LRIYKKIMDMPIFTFTIQMGINFKCTGEMRRYIMALPRCIHWGQPPPQVENFRDQTKRNRLFPYTKGDSLFFLLGFRPHNGGRI